MEKEKQDVIGSFCGCTDTVLTMYPCNYYDLSAGECLLLRERKMDEFWEKGRCAPFEMLCDSMSKCLERLKNKAIPFPSEPAESYPGKKLS